VLDRFDQNDRYYQLQQARADRKYLVQTAGQASIEIDPKDMDARSRNNTHIAT